MQLIFSTLFKQKFKNFEILSLILLLFFLYLTFKFNWWENFKFQKIDIIILCLSSIFLFFRSFYIISILVLGSLFFINIYGVFPILSNIFLFLTSYLFGNTLLKAFKYDHEIIQKKNTVLSICLGLSCVSIFINIFSFFNINTPLFYFLFFFTTCFICFFVNLSD